MEQAYKDGTPLPDHHIAHMMIAVLFGGQHTSATTSTWAILELAHKPELIRALREEQIEALGSLSEPLDYDSLKKLSLLDSVVRESLRLHPPLFILMRKVMSDITFDKTGHVIPTGDYLAVSPGVTQLDPTYFKNPMEFNPRRWLDGEDGMHQLEVGADANEDYGFGAVGVSGRSPYLPFGAGMFAFVFFDFFFFSSNIIFDRPYLSSPPLRPPPLHRRGFCLRPAQDHPWPLCPCLRL